MFEGLKKLFFGKQEAPPPPAPPSPKPPAPPAKPPAPPAPAKAAAPAKPSAPPPSGGGQPAPAAPRPAAASGGADSISVPARAIVGKLPEELKARVKKEPSGSVQVAIPLGTVLSQLPNGHVRIAFSDLVAALPPGSIDESGADGSAPVEVPLSEVVSRLKPEHMTRRSGQKKVEVPDDVTPIFGSKGEPLSSLRQGTTSKAAAPSAPAAPPPPAPAPAAPAPAPAPAPAAEEAPIKPASSLPSPESLRPSEESASIKPAAKLPDPASLRPASAPSTPPLPRPPGASSAAPPLPKPPGSSAPPLPKPPAPRPPSPAPPPPPAPPAPALPKPSAAVPPPAPAPAASGAGSSGSITLSLAQAMPTFPDALKAALAGLDAQSTVLKVPVKDVDPGLKRGRVAIGWRQLRGFFEPALDESVAADLADNEIELPLSVVAPLFLAAVRPAKPQKKVTVADNIPDLFTGKGAVGQVEAPAAEAAPAASAPAPVPAAAPAAPSGAGTGRAPQTMGEIFGDPGRANWPAAELVERTARLTGIAGAIIATGDGLLVAGKLPPHLKGDALAGFLPQAFARLAQYSKDMGLGTLDSLRMTVGEAPCEVHKAGDVFLAVVGKSDDGFPGGLIKIIARDLARGGHQ